LRLLSVGYGNRTFDGFLDLMRQHQVTHVVDVRSVPYSNYQTEFRQENLQRLLPGAGLKYVYMGDSLGGANVRASLDGNPDAAAFRDLGLDRLVKALVIPDAVVVLMCGCLMPDKCHRGETLGRFLLAREIEYVHLDREGALVGHEAMLMKATGGQGSLFYAS
jgi:uncharacterized protein (DUF488 family)